MVAAGALLLGGCATFDRAGPPAAPADTASAAARSACLTAFERVDAAVAADGAADGSAYRIPGFPYLRVDRLLASYRDALPTPAAERFWVDRLLALDRAGRAAELANLRRAPTEALVAALAHVAPGESPTDVVVRCGRTLREADDRDPARRALLRANAVVPDDYSTALRALGLYPITSLGFARGIRGWQRETVETFAVPLEERATRGLLWSYAPPSGDLPSADAVARILRRSSDNPLGLPLPTDADLEVLVRGFAPIFEVDTRTDDDRIGAPVYAALGRPRVDTRRPTVYVRTSATRVGERTLLQIVYTAWFPARPKTGALDLLGGPLDGLVWRVTFAPDGRPLVFDTIHPCGCYHLFFPRPGIAPRPAPDGNTEFVFVPQQVPDMPPGTRAVLRIASGTHYLEHVAFEPAGPRAIGYEIARDDDLRSLSVEGGVRRSLYAPDGLVRGSERAERFLFWPMGIASAGAMRQWGRHATAFVGRRHFDDARLLEERFDLRKLP
jgi:hypothetical protein